LVTGPSGPCAGGGMVDALASGASVRKGVGVQIPPRARTAGKSPRSGKRVETSGFRPFFRGAGTSWRRSCGSDGAAHGSPRTASYGTSPVHSSGRAAAHVVAGTGTCSVAGLSTDGECLDFADVAASVADSSAVPLHLLRTSTSSFVCSSGWSSSDVWVCPKAGEMVLQRSSRDVCSERSVDRRERRVRHLVSGDPLATGQGHELDDRGRLQAKL
jgi:hypothetical protein